MKTFCPCCYLECVSDGNGRSRCCVAPVYIGCDGCGKRLVQLDHIIPEVRSREQSTPLLCYACYRRRNDKTALSGIR